MGLTNKREEQIKKMPYIETKVEKSKDGKYVINRTTITHIRPIEYYQAVLDDKKEVQEEL